MTRQQLGSYRNEWFDRGRPAVVEALWILASIFVSSSLPGSGPRVWLLKLFGARLGTGVVIKPGVKVKFPWRLEIGEHTWIGEGAWIDNLDWVRIGDNCCLSQGVYICTGSHDWSKSTFNLIVKPVSILDGSWLGASCQLAPGVTVGEDAVIAMGSTLVGDAEPSSVYQGNPAQKVRAR